MRNMKKRSLSVVDVLVGLAVLLVLAGLFVPFFVKPSTAAPAARAAHQLVR